MSLLLGAATRLGPTLLGTRGTSRLSILIFHRVLPARDVMRPDEPTQQHFDWQMRLLRQHFNPLSVEEGVRRLHDGTLPERAVCVTFDDGYADNLTCALPVLERYQIPASIFISTGFLDGGRMWNDTVREAVRIAPGEQLDLADIDLGAHALDTEVARLACAETVIKQIKHRDPAERARLVDAIAGRVGELPADLMLTTAQLRALSGGLITIGAHTVNHPILASVSASDAAQEIGESKRWLEDVLQQPVTQFAYPNGAPGVDYGLDHRDLVEGLGFRLALSTHWGVVSSDSDVLQLPRFTPWDSEPLRFAVRLLLNYRRVDPLVAAGEAGAKAA